MVTFLPTPIGNLQDITINTIEALKQCDVLLCEDTRVSKKLIALLVERDFLPPKDYIYHSFHTHNEDEFLQNVKLEFFSQNIGFLSDAGMPCISDPGVKLVRFLQKHKLEFNVLGGISALTLAVAFSGIIEKEFCFLGFLPHKLKDKEEAILKAFDSPFALVVYESPHRLLETLEIMAKVDAKRVAFLAKELTKKYQQTFKDSLQNLLQDFKKCENSTRQKGEWVIVLEPQIRQKEQKMLTEAEILTLDIPPKIKAKILAKLHGVNASVFYEQMIRKI